MKTIPLSQHINCRNKKEKQFAIVDDEDYEYLNQWNWHLIKAPHTFYAQRAYERKNIKMHRELIGLTDSKIYVDHIDHNGLNNQKSNLRKASPTDSCRNRRCAKGSVSKYLGVTWNKSARGTHKWMTRIRVNRKSIYVGSFKNEIDAAKKYDEAAIKYFGEFANLNFKTTIIKSLV